MYVNLANDLDREHIQSVLLGGDVELEDIELIKHNLELIRVLCKQAIRAKEAGNL